MTEGDRDWRSFALLLIDVQKDFWTGEMDVAFPDFEENVAGLLELCRREGIDVIHLRAMFSKDKSDWMVRYLFRESIPCVAGTAGARHFDCAAENGGEPVIVKQTFDGFLNPELPGMLDAAGKRYVLVAGLVTSVCVLLTAAAAAQRGYLVGLVEDCCADKPEAHLHTLDRYPFVFDPVTRGGIVGQYDNWTRQLAALPSR